MPLSVAWFIPVQHRDYDKMPASVWIRCLQLIPYLEKKGVSCFVNERGRHTDIAVFVRRQDPDSHRLAKSLKAEGIKIVFDLNVNYFDETGLLGDGYGTTPERVRECLDMVSLADVVCCASTFIAGRARAHHPRVVNLPDSFDAGHFRRRKEPGDFDLKPLRAIWSGVQSKAHELEPLLPLLESRGVPLTVISDAPPRLSGPYVHIPWSYETFPRCLLEGELCVGPRTTDNPYDQGHSIFKIGVFMSEGVPVLASPVPSYAELLGRSDCGRICRSPAEWEIALDEVLSNRYILRRWSDNSVEAVRPYRTETVAERYVELFQNV